MQARPAWPSLSPPTEPDTRARISAPQASSQRGYRRQRGVTLTSLMVGLTMSLLVLATASAVYVLSARGTRDNLQQARLNQELRAVLELMQLDIRRAGYWNRAALSPGFDADCDGLAEGDDLSPVTNPFQNRCGAIDNDLRPGEPTDGADSSCLLLSYDANADGRIGFCASCEPEHAPFDASPYNHASSELQGFRLRRGAVQVRTGSLGGDRTFDCGSGRWEGLTSAEVRITDLGFALASDAVNVGAPALPCEPGVPCLQRRRVAIRLEGALSADPRVRQVLTTTVRVRNDRYFLPP